MLIVLTSVFGCGRVGYDPLSFSSDGALPDGNFGSDSSVDGNGLEAGLSDPWIENAPLRKRITIASDTITQEQTNFPLLVVLDDTDILSLSTGDGSDVVFYDQEGQLLAYELEEVAPNRIVAWVQIPILSADVDTHLYVGFGSESASDRSDPETVWNGYRLIWHFAEVTGDALDSTAYDMNGAVQGATQGVEGRIGPAYSFDGNDDRVLGTDPPDGHLDFNATESFCVSLWVQTAGTTGDFQTFFDKGAASNGEAGYHMESTFNASNLGAQIHDGAGGAPTSTSSFDLDAGTWVHAMMVVDRNTQTLRLFQNGVPYGTPVDVTGINPDSAPNTEPVSVAADGEIGSIEYEAFGIIDEVRVYAGVLSDERISLEVANQSNPSSFVSLGSLESM